MFLHLVCLTLLLHIGFYTGNINVFLLSFHIWMWIVYHHFQPALISGRSRDDPACYVRLLVYSRLH